MSRRKQSNPVKSVTDDSEDESDACQPDVGLPSNILHLDRTLTPPVLSSISTILEGSQFGPFPCSISEATENNKPRALKLHFSGRKHNVHITSPSGGWLHLVKTSPVVEETNLQFLLLGEKIVCLVTKNIPPDEEVVASSRAKLMGGAETDHVGERNHLEINRVEKNHTDIKMETAEVEKDRKSIKFSPSVMVKNEPRCDEWTVNSRTTNTTQQQTHGKNIMIQNLLNRTKPSYELVHECIFCGVKFSNPRTLQAHLTNYCSKKPQFDLCSSPQNFIFYSILPNHLRYNFLANQLRPSPDIGPINQGLSFRKNNSSKTTRNVESIADKSKNEEEIKKEFHSELIGESTTDEQNNPSNDAHSYTHHLKDLLTPSTEAMKYSDDKQDIFQPFPSFKPSSNSLNPQSGMPLLNYFQNFPLEVFKKNFFDNHPLPPFLNPFFLYPSYFMNSPSSSKPTSDLSESVDNQQNKHRVMIHSPKSPSNHETPKDRSSVEDKLKSGLSKVENPLDLSSKKESLTANADISEGMAIKKSHPVDAMFSGKSRTPGSRSSELKLHEPALPFRMNPPSTNRCVECNIVFFKTENYLAHKQHYCASRNNRTRDVDQQQNSSKSFLKQNEKSKITKHIESSKVICDDQPNSDLNNNNDDNSDMELVATLNKGVLQYYCIPCKIKFSNLETLKAHKKFYCSSRFNRTGRTPERQAEESSDIDEAKESEKKVFSCSVCRVMFPSEQLLMLHFCTGVASNYQLYQCPHCDHIAQSDSRLMEHIRGHAPSKVYKCVLCGYRGNTVRGMRMHGKMHNDAGETFTDESMMEVEEPPVIPKRAKLNSIIGDSAFIGSVVDMPDLELIRLKNEPYKRRRSRKAYEKSEYMKQNENSCFKCEISFPLGNQFQMHMLNHMNEAKIGSSSILPNKLETFCNHLEASNGSPSTEASNRSIALSSNSFQEGPSNAKLLKLSPPQLLDKEELNINLYPKFETKEVDRSSEDEPITSSPPREIQISSDKSKTSFSKYCKQCNINFMYASTYLAHKKYYCSNQIEEDADISVC